MSHSRFIGGILLIIGTSIGGGILALPVATAAAGVGYSSIFLVFCWLIMTAGALLILEVNIRLPAGSNMISMAKSTLGLPGQIVAWITYLFLLYTLVAAYIAGGTDVFGAVFHKINFNLPAQLVSIILTALLSYIIYQGIRTVDYVNRFLMFSKMGVFLLLVFIISPHIDAKLWRGGSLSAIPSTIMLLFTSFGYATIVPSLREYFHDDKALRLAIILGSFIPLLCYILWEAIIMGVIQREGSNGLINLMTSEHSISGLTAALNYTLQNKWITGFFTFFTSICMFTSFLGASLGLFDFLADGFKLKRQGIEGKYVLALTLTPPLLLVLIMPGIFIKALNYAGTCCVILLLLLPVLMAWQARKLTNNKEYNMVPGGRFILILLILISILLLSISIYI